MFLIWYVLHCVEGEEKTAVELLRQQFGNLGKTDIFLITFERMRRYEGNWHCREEILFQGYVFVEDASPGRLEKAAQKAMVFRSFRNGRYSLCLKEAEKEFLEDMSEEAHRIPMSKGFIRNGITFVTEGPLCGKEYRIRKIDRHKRMARIASPMACCLAKEFWTGLEITAKS